VRFLRLNGRNTFYLGLVLSFLVFGSTQACRQRFVLESICRHIDSRERETGGIVYAPASMTARGDLDRDGQEDFALIYTLEGENHSDSYRQYLLVSSSRRSGVLYEKEVGGKSVRAVTGLKLREGKIELACLEYAPSDAACCPIFPSGHFYRFDRERLVEYVPR
jgi:hypothetical protein